MTHITNRRTFLAGVLAAPMLANSWRSITGADAPKPTLDIHVHLFGVGEGGTGCRPHAAGAHVSA